MTRNCKICDRPIPEGRLKALPSAVTCVNCSTVQQKGGFHPIQGKNEYSELQVLDPDLALKMRRLQNRPSYSANIGVNHYTTTNNRDNKER